jgi:hypothetical protein
MEVGAGPLRQYGDIDTPGDSWNCRDNRFLRSGWGLHLLHQTAGGDAAGESNGWEEARHG